MAIILINSNYDGEVLEKILTKACTGNELVQKGLIHIEPNITKKFSIPRMKTGKMLQKRKEQPKQSDAKGTFSYDEKALIPHEFMAFTTFNPEPLKRFGAPSSRRETWYLRNFRPKVKTCCFRKWRRS